MAGIFWPDIEAILTPGVNCMKNVQVATDEGVFLADLTDYDTVVRLHAVIGSALNAWERNSDGTDWVDPPEPTKAHPMPPFGPLAMEDVDTYLAWVDDGMPKDPPLVG